MSLSHLIKTAPTWGLTFPMNGDPYTAPLSHFTTPPQQTISIIEPMDLPTERVEGETRHIKENAQEFDVTYYDFEGYQGLYHHHGKNWILWRPDLSEIYVARGSEAWARTWTYAKFILRHFVVGGLMQRQGYRRSHAVAGTLAGEQAGVLIAGKYLSGKTYLLNRLLERGLLVDMVEDDCAVIDDQFQVRGLLPVETEMQHTNCLPIRIMICLDNEADSMTEMAPYDAAAWAFGLSASWPLTWLPPVVPIPTSVEYVPKNLVALRVPEKPAIEPTITAIEELIRRAR